MTRSLPLVAGLGSVLVGCAGDAPTAPVVNPPTQDVLLPGPSDAQRADLATLLADARERLLPALDGPDAEMLRSALDPLASGIGTRPVESSIQAAAAARVALLAIRSGEGHGVRPWSADVDALLLTLEALQTTLVSAAPHLRPPTAMEER